MEPAAVAVTEPILATAQSLLASPAPDSQDTTQQAAEFPNSQAAVPPAPAVEESDMDRRRRLGIEEFDAIVRELSRKADQADIAWERFRAGCRENISRVTSTAAAGAFAGVADRDWLAFAGAWAASSTTVESRSWTEACAEAGTFFALFDQVRAGMCAAEDRARRASVLPGTRRDIRARYRLSWSGWDNVCLDGR